MSTPSTAERAADARAVAGATGTNPSSWSAESRRNRHKEARSRQSGVRRFRSQRETVCTWNPVRSARSAWESPAASRATRIRSPRVGGCIRLLRWSLCSGYGRKNDSSEALVQGEIYHLSESLETLGHRARYARKLRGLSMDAVEDLGGPSRPTLHRIERQPTYEPEDYTLERLAKVLQVNLQWLKTGEGLISDIEYLSTAVAEAFRHELRKELGGGSTALEPLDRPYHSEDPDQIFLPLFETRPAAGPGNHVHRERPATVLPFSRTWLRSIDISPQDAAVLKVQGDSMEPTLRHGEMVFLDTKAALEPLSAGIWVFSVNGQLFVKRLDPRPDGEVLAHSDNANYSSFTVDLESPSFKLIGRVVWAGRRP